MASNEFFFKIDGPDVSPENVDIGELAEALRLVRATIVSIADGLNDSSGDVSLSLVQIADGSDLLTIQGSPLSLRATQILAKSLATNTTSRLPERSHKYIRELWQLIRSNGWDRCAFIGNGSSIGHGEILSENELFPDA